LLDRLFGVWLKSPLICGGGARRPGLAEVAGFGWFRALAEKSS